MISDRATKPSQPPSSRWLAILTDSHFWVPMIVLLMGLAVLRWIS